MLTWYLLFRHRKFGATERVDEGDSLPYEGYDDSFAAEVGCAEEVHDSISLLGGCLLLLPRHELFYLKLSLQEKM